MTVLKGEIKVVVQVMEEIDDHNSLTTDDFLTMDDVATRIIEALDEHRSKKAMASIIARFSADGGKTWRFFLYGPYKSKAIAKQKSSGLFPPGSPLQVKWLILDHVKDFRKEVLAAFKDTPEASAWDVNSVPVELLQFTTWAEPTADTEDEAE